MNYGSLNKITTTTIAGKEYFSENSFNDRVVNQVIVTSGGTNQTIIWLIDKFSLFEINRYLIIVIKQYGTHHSYVLVVYTLRVAENEILKLDFPAKRH
jgi:hypothetical protein